MIRRRHRRQAFTLMEILLVLAILVVLASMVGVSYVRIQQSALKSSCVTQVKLLEDAVKTYILDVGSLPSDLNSLIQSPPDLANPVKWQGPYLDKQQLPVDPWNNPFVFQPVDPDRMTFKIYSYGPNRQDEQGGGDDIATAL